MKRKITRKEYNHIVLNTRIFHKTYGERRRKKEGKREKKKKKKKKKKKEKEKEKENKGGGGGRKREDNLMFNHTTQPQH